MSLKFLRAAPFLPIKALPIIQGQKPALPQRLPGHSSWRSFPFLWPVSLCHIASKVFPAFFFVCVNYLSWLMIYFPYIQYISYIFDKHLLSIYNMWAASWAWGGPGQKYRDEWHVFALVILTARWGHLRSWAPPCLHTAVFLGVSKMSHAYRCW